MAKQSKFQPPNYFAGPFLGLNTTETRPELAHQFASKARNVLFSNGRLQPHPPWDPFVTKDGKPFLIPHNSLGQVRPLSMYMFQPTAITTPPIAIVNTVGGMWAVSESGIEDLAGDVELGRACGYVSDGDWVYVLTGGNLWRTKGSKSTTHHMGLQPPPAGSIEVTSDSPISGPGTEINADYALTLSNEDRSVESNPLVFVGKHRADFQTVKFVFRFELLIRSGQHFDWINVYRKNLDLSQIPYRLIHRHTTSGTIAFYDGLDETAITLSSTTTGPWAPAKNGVPKNATCGVIYRNRLFLNDVNNPNRINFSEIDRYQHFDPDDFRQINSPTQSRVSGLMVQDQVVLIGKADGIWALSGTVRALTNEQIAVGADPLPSTDITEPTRVTIGPGNTHGNGFVKVGAPGRVYFPTRHGFYRWDGIDAVMVSDLIVPTWQDLIDQHDRLSGFVGDSSFAFSFGQDVERKLLYIGLGTSFGALVATERVNQNALVYHYGANRGDGVGLWSTVNGVSGRPYWENLDSENEDVYLIPSVFASGPDGRAVMASMSGLLVRLRRGLDVPTLTVPQPEMFYESGDMALLPGFQSHVYGIKWLTAAPVNGVPGVAFTAHLGLKCDDRTIASHVDLNDRGFVWRRIGAQCSRVRVFVRSYVRENEDREYHRDNLIIGWMLDSEPVGQR